MFSFFGIPLFGYFFKPILFTIFIILWIHFIYNKYFVFQFKNTENIIQNINSKTEDDEITLEESLLPKKDDDKVNLSDETLPKVKEINKGTNYLVKIFYMTRTNKSQVSNYLFIYFFK